MDELKEPKKKLYTIAKRAALVLLAFVLGSLFFESKKVFFGVTLGGGLSLANLLLSGKIVEGIFQKKTPNKAPIIIGYIIKILFLFGVLFFLITRGVINPIAFVVGFSSVFLAAGMETLFPSRGAPKD